ILESHAEFAPQIKQQIERFMPQALRAAAENPSKLIGELMWRHTVNKGRPDDLLPDLPELRSVEETPVRNSTPPSNGGGIDAISQNRTLIETTSDWWPEGDTSHSSNSWQGQAENEAAGDESLYDIQDRDPAPQRPYYGMKTMSSIRFLPCHRQTRW